MVCSITLLVAAAVGATSAQDLQVSQQNFADELTTTLYEDNKNECTSSLGVSMAFALVYPSMIDDSKIEVAEVLGFPENNTSTLVWDEKQNDLNTLYDGSCLTGDFDTACYESQPIIEISNSIWVDSGSGQTLNIAYEQLVRDLLFFIDFSAADAGTSMNTWVDTASNGLIDSIFDDGPLDLAIMVAINVIYMKANWLNPFYEPNTNQDIFYERDGSTPVRQDSLFMHDVDYYRYSHEAVAGFQIIQIPFTGGTLSMIFVLPSSAVELNSTRLIGAVPNLKHTKVALAIPKFQFESEYKGNLKDSLQAIGIVEPFHRGNKGICIYEGDCDAYMDVLQKTYISLDENGVEGAAVTVGTIVPGASNEQPVLMQLDRPFQFFIYDSSTDLMIFEGHVVDPIPQDDAPVVQMTASHADDSFWMNEFYVDPLVVEPTEVSPTVMPTPTVTPTPMESTTTIKPTEQQTTKTPFMITTPATSAPTTQSSTLPTATSSSAPKFYYVSVGLTLSLLAI